MLARRLINQQSTSMDAEEFMVTKLKVFCLCVTDSFKINKKDSLDQECGVHGRRVHRKFQFSPVANVPLARILLAKFQ